MEPDREGPGGQGSNGSRIGNKGISLGSDLDLTVNGGGVKIQQQQVVLVKAERRQTG